MDLEMLLDLLFSNSDAVVEELFPLDRNSIAAVDGGRSVSTHRNSGHLHLFFAPFTLLISFWTSSNLREHMSILPRSISTRGVPLRPWDALIVIPSALWLAFPCRFDCHSISTFIAMLSSGWLLFHLHFACHSISTLGIIPPPLCLPFSVHFDRYCVAIWLWFHLHFDCHPFPHLSLVSSPLWVLFARRFDCHSFARSIVVPSVLWLASSRQHFFIKIPLNTEKEGQNLN